MVDGWIVHNIPGSNNIAIGLQTAAINELCVPYTLNCNYKKITHSGTAFFVKQQCKCAEGSNNGPNSIHGDRDTTFHRNTVVEMMVLIQSLPTNLKVIVDDVRCRRLSTAPTMVKPVIHTRQCKRWITYAMIKVHNNICLVRMDKRVFHRFLSTSKVLMVVCVVSSSVYNLANHFLLKKQY